MDKSGSKGGSSHHHGSAGGAGGAGAHHSGATRAGATEHREMKAPHEKAPVAAADDKHGTRAAHDATGRLAASLEASASKHK